MKLAYDPHAPRRAVNLTVNADLLKKAKGIGVNLSSTLEQALVEKLRQKRREQWLADNRDAIDAYNRQVERDGVFSNDLRKF